MRHSLSERIFNVFNITILLLFSISTIYPFWYVACGSFSDGGELMGHSGLLLLPLDFNFAAYESVFKNNMVITGFINSVIVLVGGTALNMLLSAIGAYVLSRKNVYWNSTFMKIITVSMFFGGGLIPYYLLTAKTLGLNNSLLALILPSAINTYNLIVMRTSFSGIPVRDNYENAGLSISLYYSLICDITCKMRECRARYNIIGVSSFNWFHKQFLMQLFSLGRFQYVKGEFSASFPYCFKDITVNPGDDVYYIHIPSGDSMTEKKRYASYKKAFDFFGKKSGEHIIFVCESWLLYPQNKFIFPENSNLMGFLNDFDIIKSYEHEEPFRNAWCIFYKNYEGDTSVLPHETTLQKNYIKWLDAGNKVGIGYGIIIFDGEKIVNKQS